MIATKMQGISLGDRACLALAQTLDALALALALTADRPWLELELGIRVVCIRPGQH